MKPVRCVQPCGALELNKTYTVVSENAEMYFFDEEEVEGGEFGFFKWRFLDVGEAGLEDPITCYPTDGERYQASVVALNEQPRCVDFMAETVPTRQMPEASREGLRELTRLTEEFGGYEVESEPTVTVNPGDTVRINGQLFSCERDPNASLRPIDDPDQGPSFVDLALEVGELVTQKNAAYGNSHEDSGEFLRLLYPDGLKPRQYADALTLVRMFDKQKRIASGADGEDPYQDLTGYGLLGLRRTRKNQEEA